VGAQQDVVLSVTVLDARTTGSLFVFSDGSSVPPDPNVVFRAGTAVTVELIVPLTGPTIDFWNNSGATIQILADLQGYGVPPTRQ